MSLPVFYDYINSEVSRQSPNTVHVQNSVLAHMFKRYLLQEAIAVFEWDMPDTWSADYFLYSLFGYGYVAVINTNRYGVIPQHCSLSGIDVFYRPNRCVISNPLINTSNVNLMIDVNCSLIRLQPDYGGVMDLVNYYGDLMAMTAETMAGNIFNSKLSYLFATESKTGAESLKKMYDKIAGGEPAVFYDRQLLGSNGEPSWMPFTQNVGQNYIGDRLLEALKRIEETFLQYIGIPNTNTDKKERMIVDEVNANNVQTQCLSDLWLEQLKKDCEKCSNMFGIRLNVNKRYAREEDSEDGVETVDNGTVSI